MHQSSLSDECGINPHLIRYLSMLRKAIQSDASTIKELIDKEASHSHVLPRSLEEILSVIDCFYVWEKNGVILGCCALEVYSPRFAEIRSLVVRHGHRREGIGQKLVDVCVKEAKKRNVYKILAVTDRVNFFEEAGFNICLNGQYAMFMKNEKN